MALCFIAIVSHANAQNKVYPFNPDGSPYSVDTSKVKSLKNYIDFSGYKFLESDFLDDKNKTMILYVPLSYKPVVVFAKDSLDVLRALQSYSKTKYVNGNNIEFDFDSLVDLKFTRTDVIELLGEPTDESDSREVYTILTYPGFTIRCIKSIYPENCTIDKLIRYDFSGAKKSGIGIADFHINLSDLDEDYVTGFRGSFMNMSKKKIKYLYITVRAVNAVGDLVTSKTATAIGPILSNEVGSYSFESLFFTKIVESIRITSLKIKYFDGTVKIINGPLLKASFLEK